VADAAKRFESKLSFRSVSSLGDDFPDAISVLFKNEGK
jgi:hypothetical protein